MPLDLIGQVIGIVGGAIQAPERAAERRAELVRLEHERRIAELQAEQRQTTMRTAVIVGGIGVAGVVAFMALKE